jgi:hypothetical protein
MLLASVRRASVLAALTLVIGADSFHAQTQTDSDPLRFTRVASTRQPFYVGVNVGLNLAIAMTRAWVSHNPLRPAVEGGFFGGLGDYAGMRLLGSQRPALRFVGLQTVAASASIARNMAGNAAWDSRFTIPLYPVVLTIRPRVGRDTGHVQLQLSVSATIAAIQALSTPRWHLSPDWRRSLSAGNLVLQANGQIKVPESPADSRCRSQTGCDPHLLYGFTIDGIPFYTTASPDPRATLTHELEHVAQFTREAIPFGGPVSEATWSLFGPVGRTLGRWLILDNLRPVHALSDAIGPSGRWPDMTSYTELEAEAMLSRWTCANATYRCRW